MSSDHEHGRIATDLGAYVLSALDPAERHRVEAHLEVCQTCRDEVARLSGLPELLDRLSLEEVTSRLADAPGALVPALRDEIVAQAVTLHRSVRRWRAGAAAAAALAALAAAPHVVGLLADDADEPPPVEVELVAAAEGPVEGSAAAYDWEWGTTIALDVAGLPERSRYLIWVVDTDGAAQVAGTWGPTADRSASVRSATAVARSRIATIEVRDEDDAVLTFAELPDRSDPSSG